jgi:hypothetical protein
MRMVPQSVRDVTQEEEPESVCAIIEVTWPGYDPEKPRGNQGQRMNDLMPIFRKIGLSVGMQLRRESSG